MRIISTVILLFLSGLQSLAAQTITIYHTNNNNGTLENCYCPDHPLGSMEKRLAYLKEVRKNDPDVILLDAGDFLSVSARQGFKDSLVCEAYALTGYDAVIPGDQELFRDDAFLKRVLPAMKTPIIASNLEHGLPVETIPYLIIEKKGRMIGILGTVGEEAFRYYPEDVRNRYTLTQPETSIKEILDEIGDMVDLTVLLSHQGYEKDRELAAKIDGVDIIIGAHTQTVVTEPEEVNGILITQGGKEGYYLGKITVEFSQDQNTKVRGELIPMLLDMPNDPQIEALIRIYEQSSGHVNPRKTELLERK